jgi:DNA invertase Pin-like site-specific DNA recombinase
VGIVPRGDTVIGYARLSKAAENGYSVAAQVKAIDAACAYRGWRLLRVETDPAASGKTLRRRPGLERAINACQRGEASGIIAAKLDRISRSVKDFADLLERAQKGGWNIVVLEPEMDLSSPYGEAMANILMTFAQLERRMISARTKTALAEAKAQGVSIGRPQVLPSSTIRRIHELRRRGNSLRNIASILASKGVPTAHGGVWRAGTVQKVLRQSE